MTFQDWLAAVERILTEDGFRRDELPDRDWYLWWTQSVPPNVAAERAVLGAIR